jgi:hypothetical protein
MFCYRKQPTDDLATVQWKRLLTSSLIRATKVLQLCEECLPQEEDAVADVCRDCRTVLQNGRLPKSCSVNNMHIGCEHRYPKELDDLSPVEERLIALQAPFGYITKFTVNSKTPSGLHYRKHVKGHIVVFPNNVDDLVATVLPHPLLEAIENIHISWNGSSKPNPADVGHLLQVRKTVVRNALVWLQRNNPLYEHIAINSDEIDSWHYESGSNVPAVILGMMRHEEPSIAEKTQTDHIVPPTDRGLPDNQPTTIEEILNSAQLCADGEHHDSDMSPGEPVTSCSDRLGNVNYETSSSGMFPLDEPATFSESDKLSFIANAMQINSRESDRDVHSGGMNIDTAGEQPFIRVERGSDFADNLHEDFFPRTFPRLFPWGRGGPKATRSTGHRQQCTSENVRNPTPNHSLTYWTKYVLQRHGGRFATHPVFSFLIFNILLRSSNRRISMVRMAKGSFNRAEQVCQTLTAEQLRLAEVEMRRDKVTTDKDVSFLLRELSIFGYAQPLSNETRLLMRRKIQSLIIWTGTPAIWFTINPNDINNPVKMKLSVHRLYDRDVAEEFLAEARGRFDKIALSTLDPVSSVIFFHREISLFFEHYAKAGKESIFGKVSHYYATVETNDRGSLHLHGLLWLHGNLELPSLCDSMADPQEDEYRSHVIRYVDSVFHECLDEKAGRTIRKERKPIDPVNDIMISTEALTAAFEDEANYIAYCSQVHSHTFTCIKYSLKGLSSQDTDAHKRTACRFKAPWKIVEETGFVEDSLLRIRRNHALVNRYNKAMAVGLRHNHDISLILTRTKGLAMVFYITNYATKLDTPMWKRIAIAGEVLGQLHQSADGPYQTPSSGPGTQHPTVLNQTRQFLMRAANRIFSERQLSSVEVCYHLLGYHTDFTNVPQWSFINLSALYWSIFRRWRHLRSLSREHADVDDPPETIGLRDSGRTLLYLDAYARRGPILRSLCLYDYMSMVSLERCRGREEDEAHISLDGLLPESDGWLQKLRGPPEYTIPIFQGYISDDHNDEHPVYFKR